jgi:hypothetical protein
LVPILNVDLDPETLSEGLFKGTLYRFYERIVSNAFLLYSFVPRKQYF